MIINYIQLHVKLRLVLQLLSSPLRLDTNAKVVHGTSTPSGCKKYEELHEGPEGRKAEGSKGFRVH